MFMRNLGYFALCVCLLCVGTARLMANDGVFYSNGSHLLPMNETDIRIDKEVLTITLDETEYAHVDVYYEFFNPGTEKTLKMGFEAESPEGDYSGEYYRKQMKNKEHPFIKHFTAEMNGRKLKWTTDLAVSNHYEDAPKERMTEMYDMSKFYFDTESYGLKLRKEYANASEQSDDYYGFSHAYLFDATFVPGRNIIHHTYTYRVNNSVMSEYEVAYWLTPAMRWAGGKIGDFTLIIDSRGQFKHFCIDEGVFTKDMFRVTHGQGRIEQIEKLDYDDNMQKIVQFALRDGVVEVHASDFVPSEDFTIYAANGLDFGSVLDYYDTSLTNGVYLFPQEDSNLAPDLLLRAFRNMPYAARGYLFDDDPELKTIYSSRFWFMPDPSYRKSTKGFTKQEKEQLRFVPDED